jgi:hypothetical protein
LNGNYTKLDMQLGDRYARETHKMVAILKTLSSAASSADRTSTTAVLAEIERGIATGKKEVEELGAEIASYRCRSSKSALRQRIKHLPSLFRASNAPIANTCLLRSLRKQMGRITMLDFEQLPILSTLIEDVIKMYEIVASFNEYGCGLHGVTLPFLCRVVYCLSLLDSKCVRRCIHTNGESLMVAFQIFASVESAVCDLHAYSVLSPFAAAMVAVDIGNELLRLTSESDRLLAHLLAATSTCDTSETARVFLSLASQCSVLCPQPSRSTKSWEALWRMPLDLFHWVGSADRRQQPAHKAAALRPALQPNLRPVSFAYNDSRRVFDSVRG